MAKNKVNEILIEVDSSSEMAKVSLNGKVIMEGNFWDFHPGCHGIHSYGDFKGHESLAIAIEKYLLKKGTKVTKENKRYQYS